MSNAAPATEGRIHEFTTHSGADTVEVGRKLVRLLKPPQLLVLRGDLGTGKTTLVKGIAQALDAAEPDEVTSPTFTLIHEYDGALGTGSRSSSFISTSIALRANASLKRSAWMSYSLQTLWCSSSGAKSSKAFARKSTGEIVISSAGGDARKITVTLKE